MSKENLEEVVVEESNTVTPTITKEMKDEADEITRDARPMETMREDPIATARRMGFHRGVVVKRNNAFGSDSGYGILTGELREQGDDGVGAFCTDGKIFNTAHCTMITDVNKEILRTVTAEKMRILENAQHFCKVIDDTLDNLIYGEN